MNPNDFITGGWTVIPSRNLVVRGDEHVRLEPRVMDVLVYLAERSGDVLTKEQLAERVWRAQHVGDDVVTATIYALRKALGDDARQPRFIETVPRRGYRWIAAVSAAAPARAEAEPVTRRETATNRFLRWKTLIIPTTLVLAVAGVAIGVNTWSTKQRTRHVASAASHEAYIKGRYFLDQRSIRGWRQAIEQFERAVALDPDDPAAHAGLADAYSAMSDFGVASSVEMRPRAMKAARRALELDPKSAEGHAALGRAQFLFDWDLAAAEGNLVRATTLGPEHMPAYQALAWLESARGRYAEAVTAARMALQLDPVNIARYTELAWVLGLSGRYDEASDQVDRALQLNPRSMEAHMIRSWVLENAGRPDAAFGAYEAALRAASVPEDSLKQIVVLYRAEGMAGIHRRLLNRRSDGIPMSNTFRAQLYARAGDLDRAVESLEKAYQTKEGALAWVNVEPSFRPLRDDARFRQIAARIGVSGGGRTR